MFSSMLKGKLHHNPMHTIYRKNTPNQVKLVNIKIEFLHNNYSHRNQQIAELVSCMHMKCRTVTGIEADVRTDVYIHIILDALAMCYTCACKLYPPILGHA